MEKIRKKIDCIDDQLIALLMERFSLVLQLIDKKSSLTDVNREEAIISKIHSKYIQNVYHEIFKSSKEMLIGGGFIESKNLNKKI